MKLIFFTISVFSFFCSEGQIKPPFFINNKLINQIDIIQKRSYDTVLSYIYLSGYPDFSEIELKGIGKVPIKAEAILIGFKKDKINCIKIVETFNGIFKSKPIDLKVDSTLQSLRNQVATFESEKFLPCVIQIIPDSISPIKGFYPMELGLHQPFCSLYFKYANDFKLKEFTSESLNEKLFNADDSPLNLNFKFNSSLKLYELYSFLIELSIKNINQFYFKNK